MTTIYPSDGPNAAVRDAARKYLGLGLSVLPICGDGSKKPFRQWKRLQSVPATLAEIEGWFARPEPLGLAVVTGAVSGNLEAIDCDSKVAASRFETALRATAEELLDRLLVVESPRGRHFYLRGPAVGRNAKLAQEPNPDTSGVKPRTLIDAKGEGGYLLTPPSPGCCHPSGRGYAFAADRGFEAIPVLTAAERDRVLAAARSVNAWTPPARVPRVRPRRPRPTSAATANRPGDAFDQEADWADVLEPHGWRYAGPAGGGAEYWRRPGRQDAHSATVNYDGSNLLIVFSSSAAPFEPGRGYSKFAAFALLEFGGDFGRAARVLAGRGYGRQCTVPAGALPVGRLLKGLPLTDPVDRYRGVRVAKAPTTLSKTDTLYTGATV